MRGGQYWGGLLATVCPPQPWREIDAHECGTDKRTEGPAERIMRPIRNKQLTDDNTRS